ncbi:MAG TPA: Na+/H+ antiporter subunit E [Bacillota bacterium]|nr:Na+/H+ antiporter subunit E [Bacillota bacterium]HPW39945.1 Na+/H+ antiporter subunit E [Bacillota bacterium]
MGSRFSLIYLGLFLLFWIILCEKFSIEVFLLGIIISTFVYYLNMHFLSAGNFRIRKLPLYFLYLMLLVKEIVRANISVAIIVLSPRMNISPCIVRIKTKLKYQLHRVILANSITLTPGTLTVDLKEDELIIHCLVKECISDLIDSKFEKLLLEIEV